MPNPFTLPRATRGASAVEYGLLLTLIGGLTIAAAFHLGGSTAAPFDLAASTVGDHIARAERPTPGGSTGTPTNPTDTAAPTDPTPPLASEPDPVLLGHSYRLTGVWLPLEGFDYTAPPFTRYTPETLTLFVAADEGRPESHYPVVLASDLLNGSPLRAAAFHSLEYHDRPNAWEAADKMMDAAVFVSTGRPGYAFVVPAPFDASEADAIASGDVWKVGRGNRYTSIAENPPPYFELPSVLAATESPVYE